MPLKIARHEVDKPLGPSPFTFSAGEEVAIAGWAFLEPTAPTMPSIAMEIVSLRTGAAQRLSAQRCSRPDVAAHFGSEHLLMSGFTSTFRIGARFHGQHSVRLLQIDDERVYSIDLFEFSVPPSAYEAHARKDLAARFLRGSGLEVGALQRRLEVPHYCSVRYVDRMPLPDLLAHTRNYTANHCSRLT